MKRRYQAVLSALLLISAFSLAGCSMSVNASTGPKVSAEKIEKLASDAIEKKIGTRPEIDCGKDDIAVSEGRVIRCDVTNPQDGAVFGADITLRYPGTGNQFGLDVKVDDTPKSVPQM